MRVGEPRDVNARPGIERDNVARGTRLIFERGKQHRLRLLGAIDADRITSVGCKSEIGGLDLVFAHLVIP